MVNDVVSDEPYVLLAFKCCIEPDDHIVNKLAVWLTAYKRRGDPPNESDAVFGDDEVDFRGRISHVEILIKQRHVHEDGDDAEWYRYSIMKKIGRRIGSKVIFTPGKVHRIKTGYVNGQMQVKNYRFYRVELGITPMTKGEGNMIFFDGTTTSPPSPPPDVTIYVVEIAIVVYVILCTCAVLGLIGVLYVRYRRRSETSMV